MMDMVQQRSRGFGFVTFENGSGGAQKAIESQPINMFGKMVEVKLATPKGGRDGAPPPSNYRKPVMATTGTGEFAGLASSYGRAGWRAGYGSKAFGKAGWSVVGWDDGGDAPDKTGVSFSLLDNKVGDERPAKRTRQ
jgi:RNA recognition motif-containing protein